MVIACFSRTEEQLRLIATRLKAAGLFDQYEEEAHGESILLSVRTRTLEERETVRGILDEAGVSDLMYSDEKTA
jgi:hypothetical protein